MEAKGKAQKRYKKKRYRKKKVNEFTLTIKDIDFDKWFDLIQKKAMVSKVVPYSEWEKMKISRYIYISMYTNGDSPEKVYRKFADKINMRSVRAY